MGGLQGKAECEGGSKHVEKISEVYLQSQRWSKGLPPQKSEHPLPELDHWPLYSSWKGASMRLGLWVRFGFMLSMIWAVCAAVYAHNSDVERTDHYVKFAYEACMTSKETSHDPDLSSCEAERRANQTTWMESSNKEAAFVALAPLPFAWLAAFILVYVIRAQIVGFRAVVPWGTLTRSKRWFVGFCCLSSALALVLVIVVALNAYVDSKVPVGMATFQDFTKTGDGLVTVTGTWTRTDLADTDDTIASPLQTSKIECDKAANRCTEAQASVFGTTLMTDLVDYDIQSWTPDAIVMVRDDLCATEIFTIDLNTKAVTGAGHTTHEADAYCASNKNEKKAWKYQLGNGFKVYWELRQKARPMPLRVIYSVFGDR